jgi:hypothetical protein
MIDLEGKQLVVGDKLVCTDYNRTGLYLGIVDEVISNNSVIVQVIDASGRKLWKTRKNSSNHIFKL